jgi:hypothetical protein
VKRKPSVIARKGGIACRDKHGPEFYRQLSALGVAARRAHPPAPRPVLCPIGLAVRPDQLAFLDRVAAAAGVSRAFVLREAIDVFWERWEEAKDTARRHRRLGPFKPSGSNR